MLHIPFAPLIGIGREVLRSYAQEWIFLNIDAPDWLIVAEAMAENQETGAFGVGSV